MITISSAKLKVFCGTDISVAVEEAKFLMQAYHIERVSFKFNNVSIRISRRSSIQKVLEFYTKTIQKKEHGE